MISNGRGLLENEAQFFLIITNDKLGFLFLLYGFNVVVLIELNIKTNLSIYQL